MVNIMKEINHDLWNKSPWCYVKLQSLLEYFINRWMVMVNVQTASLSLKQKMEELEAAGYKVPSSFYHLNRLSNIIKHDHGFESQFDTAFLEEYISDFNLCVSNVLPDATELYISDDIFAAPQPISLGTGYDKNIIKQVLEKKNSPVKTSDNRITIPCGVGRHDYGFVIKYKPLASVLPSYENSIFAVIFNFLQRSKTAEKNLFIKKYEEHAGVILKYFVIYRYQMLLLTALRYGCKAKDTLAIRTNFSERENIRIAFNNISHYAQILSELCDHPCPQINLEFSDKGIPFSLIDHQADFSVEDLSEDSGDSRTYWFADDLVYAADMVRHESILVELLQDFFGYTQYRNGQLEAIVQSLNSRDRTICVMPTGIGKSLVYYMNAMLSPRLTIVVVPTKILALDQVRNLKELHNIDDAIFCDKELIRTLQPSHKLIYMIPEDMQAYDFVLRIIDFNTSYKISNVVLDEIHTLCNWSHDFRPDYLMLCNNLFSFIDHCRYLGFTATANYRVLSDLVKQLKIDFSQIIQPLEFDINNFCFEYLACKDEKEQQIMLLHAISKFLENREHSYDGMIVFTHGLDEARELSSMLAQMDNYDTDCFDAEHTYSYREYVSGAKHVLITDSDLGIGINLPNTVCTLHYGLPKSKAQYAQEIGRASRKLNSGKSIVIFKAKDCLTKAERKLLNFETSIEEIMTITKQLPSDTSHLFLQMLGSSEGYTASSARIIRIYRLLKNIDNFTVVKFPKNDQSDKILYQKSLFKLYLLGIVDNWFVRHEDDSSILVQVEVDFQKENINKVKDHALNYLNMMGNYGKYTHDISNAKEISEIIYIFEVWFYDEFLRYHREQLLNVVEFFDYYAGKNAHQEIRAELQSYFSTTLKTMDNQKTYLKSLSQEELISSNMPVGSWHANIAEQLLTEEYDPKLDLICYIYQYQKGNADSIERLLRVLENLNDVNRRNLLEYVHRYYMNMSLENRMRVFSSLLNYFPMKDVIDSIYSRINEDEIYYGYLAKMINSTVWREKFCSKTSTN